MRKFIFGEFFSFEGVFWFFYFLIPLFQNHRNELVKCFCRWRLWSHYFFCLSLIVYPKNLHPFFRHGVGIDKTSICKVDPLPRCEFWVSRNLVCTIANESNFYCDFAIPPVIIKQQNRWSFSGSCIELKGVPKIWKDWCRSVGERLGLGRRKYFKREFSFFEKILYIHWMRIEIIDF